MTIGIQMNQLSLTLIDPVKLAVYSTLEVDLNTMNRASFYVTDGARKSIEKSYV